MSSSFTTTTTKEKEEEEEKKECIDALFSSARYGDVEDIKTILNHGIVSNFGRKVDDDEEKNTQVNNFRKLSRRERQNGLVLCLRERTHRRSRSPRERI